MKNIKSFKKFLENNNYITVYRGSDDDKFEVPHSYIWVTTDLDHAKGYGMCVEYEMTQSLNILDCTYQTSTWYELICEFQEIEYDEDEDYLEEFEELMFNPTSELIEFLSNKGYDGFEHETSTDNICVFDRKKLNKVQIISELYKYNSVIDNHGVKKYTFNTNGYEYLVSIAKNINVDGYYWFGFKAKKDGEYSYFFDIQTNETPYEVMNTVVDIAIDFYTDLKKSYISMYGSDEKFSEQFKGYIFSFSGDKNKNRQRLLLYNRYINKRTDVKLYYNEQENQYHLDIIT